MRERERERERDREREWQIFRMVSECHLMPFFSIMAVQVMFDIIMSHVDNYLVLFIVRTYL